MQVWLCLQRRLGCMQAASLLRLQSRVWFYAGWLRLQGRFDCMQAAFMHCTVRSIVALEVQS